MTARKTSHDRRRGGGRGLPTRLVIEPALLQAWERTLRRRAEHRALVQAADGQMCTFRELDAWSAAWLATQAREPARLAGRMVVFALPNGLAWFEVFLGLMRAGAIAVPLDPGEPAAAQRKIAETLRAAFWWDGERLVELPNARRFRARELCFVKLTSGTTGVPRPLFFSAGQLLADARQVMSTMGITARDLNYAAIPFGHSYGLGNLVLPLIAHGVPLVCGALPLPQAIAEDLRRWQPTVFPTVPAVWRALVASDISPDALESLRLAISAGAPLAPEVARDFAARFGKFIHGFYGASETGGIAYDRTGAATLAGGVGRALRGVTIEPLRDQQIRISSAAVFTSGNTRRHGQLGAWIPPDAVQLDARGQVTLLGRRGGVVKIGGRRVSLAEVTARLRALPGVDDAWAGLVPGPEPQVGAVVASERSAAELRAAFQAATVAWKTPKKWLLVPELPLTPRGKPDTRAMQAMLEARGDGKSWNRES